MNTKQIKEQSGYHRMIAMSYRTLRNYVAEFLGKTVKDITGDIVNAFEQADIKLGEKSLERIGRGERGFSWVEAKTVVMVLIEECKAAEEIDRTVFKRMLSNFLLSCARADKNSEADEDTIDKFLSPYFESEPEEDNGENHPAEGYSNIPQWAHGNMVIRSRYLAEIKKGAAEEQILFLSGFPGTGKSFIAGAAAASYLRDPANDCRYAIWCSSTSKSSLTFNDVLTNILNAFHYSNAANLSNNEKVKYAVNCLSREKAVIVIDGFETICASEQREILELLVNSAPRDDLVIVTSDTRFSSFKGMRQHTGHFREITVNKFTYNEWEKLATKLGESQNDILTAMTSWPELTRYVYTLGEGNLKFMLHGLTSAAGKLLEGISFEKIRTYHLPELVSGSYEIALERSFEDLADNDRTLLAALSLFAVPVPLKVLSPISGLGSIDSDGNPQENSALAQSIAKCRDLYLLDCEYSDGKAKFSLSMMQPIMDSELKKNRSRYEDIIRRWLDHYIELTKDMGLCYRDFGRLDQLDENRDIDNIERLLDFCECERMWQEFYTVSENTRYYFYTRGISGQGEDSVHYRRARAAQILRNPVGEFTSLMYHCNVACKTKSQEGIEECFSRLDELQKTAQDISVLDRLKYKYIRALYAFSMDSYVDAERRFSEYEAEIARLIQDGGEISWDEQTYHDYCASLRWHSECLYSLAKHETDKGKRSDIAAEVDALLDKALELARQTNFERAIIHSYLIRTKFYYYRLDDRESAQKALQALEPYEQVIEKDASYRETYHLLQGELLEG